MIVVLFIIILFIIIFVMRKGPLFIVWNFPFSKIFFLRFYISASDLVTSSHSMLKCLIFSPFLDWFMWWLNIIIEWIIIIEPLLNIYQILVRQNLIRILSSSWMKFISQRWFCYLFKFIGGTIWSLQSNHLSL